VNTDYDSQMNIQLRFFASLREALSCSQELLAIPIEVKTIAQLRTYLQGRNECWAKALADDQPIRCALNQRMVSDSCALQDGAEVAFFPPVTGG